MQQNSWEYESQTEHQKYIKRLVSIDLLRGLVMVLMTLDHTRDFFSNVRFNPLNIEQSNLALFSTRWITHLCAPSFLFLAGVAAYLSLKRGKTKKELTRFLLLRGLLLIILELTIISFAWTFHPGVFIAGVIWVIGWSMIILSLLIHFPIKYIAIFGIILIFGHNLFDSVQSSQLSHFGWFWAFLHERARFISTSGIRLLLVYPLIPWVGVMASGYSFGYILTKTKTEYLTWLKRIGFGLIFSFIVIRGINIYGNPKAWSVQSSLLKTILDFINCEKYPPSLAYLLITLGIAFLLFYLFEIKTIRFFKPLAVFGRVPLFFYIIHIWLIHISAIVLASPKYGFKAIFLPYLWSSLMPKDYGYNLQHIYVIWIIMLLILYPICFYFANFKNKNKSWWVKLI